MESRKLGHGALAVATVVAGVTGIACTSWTGAALAGTKRTPAEVLNAGVRQMRSADKLPGVIGMVRDRGTASDAHAGWGDMFRHVPADPNARFRIGSNTKAFVSAVLLQLEAEHKLSLDDTVDRWLPGVVASNGNDGKKITVRRLLNHTSRIPDYLHDPRVFGPYIANVHPAARWDPRRLVGIAVSKAPLDEYQYSNTNYILAGMVIRAVTKHDPVSEVRKRIIRPLRLRHTTFPAVSPKLHGTWLHGYFLARDVSFSNVQASGTAGAIVSTTDDMATFTRALISGRLLPRKQQRELRTPGGYGHYALGVTRSPTKCGTVYTHSGAVLGYDSTWITSPDGKRQALVATNEFHMDAQTKAAKDLWNTALNAYCATTHR